MTFLNIVEIDHQLFEMINQEMVSGLLDNVLFFWRNKYFWVPLYLFLITYLVLNYRKQAYWLLFFLLLTFAITDFVSSSVIKPAVERARPCHEVNAHLEARLLVECGSGYSFTSSHAANHFGIAFFIIMVLATRRKILGALLIIWASLVCYSQVYVGVHFPLDVICGALLGIGIAMVTAALYSFSKRKMAL